MGRFTPTNQEKFWQEKYPKVQEKYVKEDVRPKGFILIGEPYQKDMPIFEYIKKPWWKFW